MINLIPLLADACTGQSLVPDLYAGVRDTSTCEVSINTISDAFKIVGNVIQIALFIAGFVAVAFIIIGGITYIVSGGDSAGVKKGKDTVVNAVVGLIIAMVAFGVVKFITGGFTGGTL